MKMICILCSDIKCVQILWTFESMFAIKFLKLVIYLFGEVRVSLFLTFLFFFFLQVIKNHRKYFSVTEQVWASLAMLQLS